MERVVAILMMLMGAGIAGVWTRDIVASEHVDLADGVFGARDPDSGSLFWPHWLAEYATALGLVTAGVGLLVDAPWSRTVAGIAAGALLYTSLNSLGWALAAPERGAYAAPMVAGVVVAVVAIVYLLTG